MTLEELSEATRKLQAIDDEILEALRLGRLDDYPMLRIRQEEAREQYDGLAARSFEK